MGLYFSTAFGGAYIRGGGAYIRKWFCVPEIVGLYSGGFIFAGLYSEVYGILLIIICRIRIILTGGKYFPPGGWGGTFVQGTFNRGGRYKKYYNL